MWECEWCSLHKTDASLEQHLGQSIPFMIPLREQLLEKMKLASLIGYVQAGIHFPEYLREQFTNFLPFF